MRLRIALACAAIGCAFATRAFADDRPSSAPNADASYAHPALFADVRMGWLVRSNSDYFRQAKTFGYPVPTTAFGIDGTLAYEVFPRLSLGVAGSYYAQGATRRYAKMMLSSDALLAIGRVAIVDERADVVLFRVEAAVGGGKYWIRESYSDPSLFSTAYLTNASSLGFLVGLDASVDAGPFRAVVGYAFHYAPAKVSNDLGANASAGGHEITFGFGVRI